jgi:hypothetical protein
MKAMGDTIPKFIDTKANFQSKVDRKVFKIFMELDLQEGILEEMEIERGKCKCIQFLDCWKVSFSCLNCHHKKYLEMFSEIK